MPGAQSGSQITPIRWWISPWKSTCIVHRIPGRLLLDQENRLDQLSTYIKQAKQNTPSLKAEIEIETIKQLNSFDLSVFDYILLDNFNKTDIFEAVSVAQKNNFTGEFECSGNITHKTVSSYSNLPIQRISMGCLTHSVTAFDISLLL